MRATSVEPGPGLATFAGADVDWRNAARVPTPVAADALAWARATFEGAPLAMRAFLVAGWTALLLKGSPRSDATHVLGWPVTHTEPRAAVLQRPSRLGIRATLLFSVEPDGVVFASAMVFTNSAARVVWAVVAPLHRWVVRFTLSHARPR